MLDAALFHASYAECRAAFLAAAAAADAQMLRFEHPSARRPASEALTMDAALIGPADAKHLLVMSSGTHGSEGFVGSALQTDTLRRLDLSALMRQDIAILMIHGVNPFGWSHHSRTNENQVDLNRNFVDFGRPRREHPLSEAIQRVSALSTRDGPDFAAISADMQTLIQAHGLPAVSDALQCGQYVKQDGVGFGGFTPEWSNVTLHEIWARFFVGRAVIGLIDWHTGLGQYGEPVFLCFDDPQGASYALAASWWGDEALAASNQSYQSGTRPIYSGLLIVAAAQAARAAGATPVGAVVEFGTFDPLQAAQCLWIDRWLRNQPVDADPDKVRALDAHVLHFFYPNEPKWNETALTNGRAIIDRAIAGLATA
ncbi:DUF2817 domain-containing protein [Sphingomonas oligophenolica]|uniref:DUF2817 domain-containing protein n=1 Tax=Sphingomonas oligophenolica TaxID=301154 RepID=A0ABU9YAQ8_9SPHN